MATLHQFATADHAAVGLLAGSPRDADNAAAALSVTGQLTRIVRGAKMPSVAAVYDEFAAALQFPYYFGANRDAFDECLRDWRDWLGDAPGLIVVVRDAEDLLAETPGESEWLFSALADASVRVVAQVGEPDAVSSARRWTAAGVEVVRLQA